MDEKRVSSSLLHGTAAAEALHSGVHVLRAEDRAQTKYGTLKFEGAPFDANVSLFAVLSPQGSGPALHVHPYCEVWVVRRGKAQFVAGEQELIASQNDIVIVQALVPHKYVSVGDEILDMVCIHDCGRIIQHTQAE